MFKKNIIIALLFLLVSCNSPKEADTMVPHSSTGGTTETEEQPVIVSTATGKYEDLPQQKKDEIKQMVDVIVLYIVKKWLPESWSWELSEEDKLTVARARKVMRFLSQPFFVAEVFTGSPGKLVDLESTIKGFDSICKGDYDHLPESAFYMVGPIEEAIEKAEKMAQDNK